MRTLSFNFLIFLFSFLSAISQWKSGDIIVDVRDGQNYKTVKIGKQIWMSENLNYGKFINSTKGGSQMQNDSITEKYCWENNADYCDGNNGNIKFGGFYEWNEAMNCYGCKPLIPARGICPAGWHIPSTAEWNELLEFCGGNDAYQKLFSGGTSGFDALMTGYRCTMTGSFRISATASDKRTYFWTSDEIDKDNANLVEVGMTSISMFSFYKSLGLCVRCIMD